MPTKLTEQDCLFDGFVWRSFDPKIDGWRNELPDIKDYPSVQNAKDTLALFEELRGAHRRIWRLEQEINRLKDFSIIK